MQQYSDDLRDRSIIFCVDQKPYESAPRHFSVLYPLMTLDGQRLTGQDFPNRGRVHWMLRENLDVSRVVEGSLWVGKIEDARKFNPGDEHSDMYQVQVNDVQPAGDALLEIVALNNDITAEQIRSNAAISWPRPTSKTIFLRGPNYVWGPVLTSWIPDAAGQLHISAASSTHEVFRVPRHAFEQMMRIEEFTHYVNEFEFYESPTAVNIAFVLRYSSMYKDLRDKADVIDATPDDQIVSWAARAAELSRRERQKIMETWHRITSVVTPDSDARLKRLEEISTKVKEGNTISIEVARMLAEGPIYEELVLPRLDEICIDTIKQKVEQARSQIQQQTRDLCRVRDDLKKEIEQLDSTFDKKAKEQEEALEQREKEFITSLNDREKRVLEQEKALKEKERELADRLDRVITQYRQESQKIGDNLLAELPILSQFLQLPATGQEASRQAATKMHLPQFLTHERPESSVDEAGFIEQFKSVVSRRGFVFSDEDLINFHTCVKAGLLTILAGQSGTGKSSLPRLYAEALCCRDEYCCIPVRPDWLDDRDLIGAFNPLAQRFEPSNSGLVERLIAAQIDSTNGRGGIYIICLDEMNLARVEHYFAQFLSVLEAPPDGREISLFAEGLGNVDDPYAPYRRISIGSNVRFIGTVNIDQTTHFFSPKVMDRAQVVSFQPPRLGSELAAKTAKTLHGLEPVNAPVFDGWIHGHSGAPDCAKNTLLRLNEVLYRYRLGLSYRKFQKILCYVASAAPFFDEDKALDHQFLQAVLPTLRRTTFGFDDLLAGLKQIIVPERFPRTAAMLEKIATAEPEDEYFQLL